MRATSYYGKTLGAIEVELRKGPMKPIIVTLSDAEARAALGAIGQMTDGNSRNYSDWQSQTCGSRAEWRALLRAEAKLIAARS